MEKYIEFLKQEISKRSNLDIFDFIIDNNKIEIILKLNDRGPYWSRLEYIYSIKVINNNFILHIPHLDIEVPIDSMDVFKTYFEVLWEKFINPKLVSYFKSKFIDHLPNGEVATIPNFNKITSENFSKIFYEVASDYSNSEVAENIIIENINDDLIISFDIYENRYGTHKENSIKITNRGSVIVNLCEKFEGSDIEYQLGKRINILINEEE